MHHIYEDRKFIIFNISEIDQINFEEVLETSIDTVRRSVDGSKSFIKWETEGLPPSVFNLTTKEGPYTYEEILDILSTPEWSTSFSGSF